MSDERRAEIEAAGRALADLANARDREAVRRGYAPRHVALNYEDWREEYDEEATVALNAADRVRDARGDEEQPVACCRCGRVVVKAAAREVLVDTFAEGRVYAWECENYEARIDAGARALWLAHGTRPEDFAGAAEREASWANALADAEAVLEAALNA